MSYSPICIFAYNRPIHLAKVIESLQSNVESSESDLFVFIDGPKNESGKEKAREVLDYVTSVKGFKKIVISVQETNRGLANSVIFGVSEVLKQYDSLIVLEDDLVVSPYFLKFMNEGLSLYKNDREVASIHGYVYPVKAKLTETFFLQGADCWGWATWRRAWEFFEPDGTKLLKALREKKLTEKFNFNGSYPYIQMLENQVNGKNNSWAIRWHASAFVNNMYTLYPGFSLVENIGHDNSGENCQVSDYFKVSLNNQSINLTKIKIEGSDVGYNAFKNYFRSLKPNPIARVVNFIKRRL